VWVNAQAVPLRFGTLPLYAVANGARLYRADTATAAARGTRPERVIGSPAVDLDPAGLGGFLAKVGGQPPADPAGWFSVPPGGPGAGLRYHHTTAPPAAFSWMVANAFEVSRAVIDGGRVAVTAAPVGLGTSDEITTRFGALVDGSDTVLDLTLDRGLRCPRAGVLCRIIAWPDGSVVTAAP
jgi:hypothetical protein